MMDKTQETGYQPLKRRQWEAFCAAATGYDGGDPRNATDAYEIAYSKNRSRDAARANAARLAARPEIAARCAWMRKQLVESSLMDAASIRAKIVKLRLDVIDRTQFTANKKLALEAARDLDRMGYADTDRTSEDTGVGGEGGALAAAADAVAANVRKLLNGLNRSEV